MSLKKNVNMYSLNDVCQKPEIKIYELADLDLLCEKLEGSGVESFKIRKFKAITLH